MTKEIRDVMELYAEYLDLDGRAGKARGVRGAANSVGQARFIPPDPCDIDGIGPSWREVVNEIRRRGTCSELEQLKERYSYYEELQDVEGIGPSTAQRLAEVGGIETKEELDKAIESGDILEIPRIGPKTAEKFKESL